MELLEEKPQPLQRVYLKDIPIEARRKAAWEVAKRIDDPLERLQVRLIAENPGKAIAWIEAKC
jgi:hypothetical protein